MNEKFIFTSDKETAEKLIEEGFQQIPSENGKYMFLNNLSSNCNFNKNENIVFTNKICI